MASCERFALHEMLFGCLKVDGTEYFAVSGVSNLGGSGSDWHFEHDLRCRRQLVNVIWVSKSDWQIEEFAVFGVSDLDGSDSEW